MPEYTSILLGTLFVTSVIHRFFHLTIYRSRWHLIIANVIFLLIGTIWGHFAVASSYWLWSYGRLDRLGPQIGLLPIEEYGFILVIPYAILVLFRLIEKFIAPRLNQPVLPHQLLKSKIIGFIAVIILLVNGALGYQFIKFKSYVHEVKNLSSVEASIVGSWPFTDELYGYQIVIPPGWYFTIPKGLETQQALPDDTFVMTNYHPATISFLDYLLRRSHRQPNAIKITMTFDKNNQQSLAGIVGELSKEYKTVFARLLKPGIEIIQGNTFNYIPAVIARQHDGRVEIIQFIAANSQRFRVLVQTSDGLSKNRQVIDDALSSFTLIGEDYKQDTSAWKRFDHALGFSLDIPPTYTIPAEPQRTTDEDEASTEKWEFIPTDRKNYFPFSIWVSENAPFSSAEEWKEKSVFTETHGFADENLISIAEYNAVQYKAHPCVTGRSCSTHLINFGLVFLLDSKLVHIRSDELRVIAAVIDESGGIYNLYETGLLFDRIVSTLRLPPQHSISPTISISRKSYTSKTAGISFSYPSRVPILSQDHAVAVKEFVSGPDPDTKTVLISVEGVFDSYAGYGITRFKNQNNVTPESWWNENFDLILRDRYVGSQSKDGVTFEAITVEDLPLTSFQGAGARGFIYTKGDYIYLFRDFAYHEDEKIADAILKGILPTLKFLE